MKNQIKTILLLGVLSALLIGVGGFIASQYQYVFVALVLAMNVVGYFFSDRLVLKMHGAPEVTLESAPLLGGGQDDDDHGSWVGAL